MFRFSIITFLLIALSPFNVLANNLTLSLKQFSQKLEQYHFSKENSFHDELNQISVSYVKGVGAIFTFQYRQPLQVWQAIQQPKPQPAKHFSPIIDPQKAQAEFNELRVQAKNLSHQVFSLERQLSSMKKSLEQLHDEQKQKRQEKIIVLEKELELLSNEKALLKPKYAHAEKLAKQSTATNYDDKSLSNQASYLDDIEQFIVDYSCKQADLVELAQPLDKLLFIFTATGSEQRLSDEISHFQDINLTLNITDINACNNGEISQAELKNTLVKGYF